ncbi:phenylacetate--CoA ligase family protein [Oceanidesulfovibrio marinus]|uniref:Phenylacetate--CoA ligase family protein n=1 Tax=Oceanidesulfovibrio marinus TaxID=370038 RepID=A0ABX6NED4_9BACT|nr:phenylacetate--CoA ligase family protein [Oceanidesulfovibrio marinus]QJT07960.1 phenylacetate--CoA ligase family protein [Oceanidesulfovibrio marinus]
MQSAQNRPDLYSYVARNIVAPAWALWERSPYLNHLRYLEESQYRSLNEVQADQWTRLKAVLKHAYETTAFYRERFDSIGIRPDDIRTWQDFNALPVLSKDDIRNNIDTMLSSAVPREQLIQRKTSGSTGVSLAVYVDDASRQLKRACTIRHDRWADWNLGEVVACIWGNPEYKKSWRGHLRNAFLERAVYLDTLRMDEQAMLEFHRTVLRRKPTLFFGHAHSLYLFARFVERKGLEPPRPRGVISTAMVLHDFERAMIESVFGCPVTNRYGCEEASLLACECEVHDGLHINCDTIVLECLNGGGPVAPGEVGALVVTDLTNYGMPLIRYKVGDTGRMAMGPCSCGRSYPRLASLEGRIADYVRTPEGEYISGISLTENFAMDLAGIRQLQIVQRKIDYLLFRVVPGQGWSETDRKALARLVEKRFGTAMRHDVEYVDGIQNESSGKYRFCISELGGDQL